MIAFFFKSKAIVGKNKLIEVHLQRDAGKKEGKKKPVKPKILPPEVKRNIQK